MILCGENRGPEGWIDCAWGFCGRGDCGGRSAWTPYWSWGDGADCPASIAAQCEDVLGWVVAVLWDRVCGCTDSPCFDSTENFGVFSFL